jgi:nucleoside-diphosphate-sugar epimerase
LRGHAVVTGGAGFIGSHVVQQLLRKGYTVRVVDDLSAGRESNLPPDAELVVKDVKTISRDDVSGAEIVIHCAAQVSTFKSVDYPEEDFARNAEGTFRVLETLRKHNPKALFIYTSSRSVHGDIPAPHVADENWPCNPSTFYNVHKIYGEMLCKIYSQLYGIRYVILRPSNVYGPRQPYWAGGWYNFCLPGSSPVVSNPGIKTIESLKIGDLVLTHRGRYRPVTKVFKRRYVGELIQIKTMYYWEPLSVTPEHPVLAIRCPKVFTDHWRRASIDFSAARWVMAKDLEDGDILLYPRPKLPHGQAPTHILLSDYMDIHVEAGKIYGYTRNQYVERCKGKEYHIPLKIPLNDSFIRIAALYLTEGCVGTNGKQIHIVLSEVERNTAEQLCQDIKNVFGLEPRIEVRQQNHAVNIYVNSAPLANLFTKLFGRKSSSKHLPDLFFSLPKDKLEMLIEWMIKGDGYIDLRNQSYIKYASVSKTLIYQLRDILLSLGLFPSIECRKIGGKAVIAGRPANVNDIYILSWYNHPIRRRLWISEEYVYLPIKWIRKSYYDGYVYNLEVEEDHSYVVGYHTLHNCAYWFQLAIEGKPLPIYGTGEQIRDYTYVVDTAKAYILAIENPDAWNQTFLLPTGVGTSLNQLAKKILEITGSKAGVEYYPPRKGDIQRFVGSYEKASKVLGWRPETMLDEGLRNEYEWIKRDLSKKGD